MKKALILTMCLTLLLAALIPVGALAKEKTMYVNTANHGELNLRKAMVTGANNVVIKVPYGAAVKVLSNVNKTWAKCTYKGKTGYCMRRYLSSSKPSASAGGSSTASGLTNSIFSGMKACYYKAVVRPTHPTASVNLRWAPSKAAKIHGKYVANSELIVMAENKNWCQVLDAINNVMGFMSRSFLVQP